MNETFKVRVDRIAPEGEGIGKQEGSDKVVFVPHSLPGDVLEVRLSEEHPRFQRAKMARVVEPSAHRIEPPCPYHFRAGAEARIWCGGCDWQHADYSEQLRLKREIVLDCLRRIAKLDCPVSETLPSPKEWRYRNKAQVPFQPGEGAGGEIAQPRVRAGFYASGSHRIVEFEDCLVQPEIAVSILRTVKELAERRGWPVYEEDKGRGWLRHLFIRTNSAGRALVVFVTRTPAFFDEKEAVGELMARHPEIVSVWQNVQAEKTSVILGPRWRRLAGEGRMRETIGRLALEFSPGAFLQVNTSAAEVLYRAAEEFVFEGGFAPRMLLDVYSGVGAVALWLAGRVPRVVGVEEVPQAVKDAYHNARRLGLRNASFIQGKAEAALKRIKGLGLELHPWAAVLDPPRSGCEAGVLEFLARSRAERVVYVSCNPATFARDAARLCSRGYRLEKIRPVDLFPQTSHVELVARLEYRGSGVMRPLPSVK